VSIKKFFPGFIFGNVYGVINFSIFSGFLGVSLWDVGVRSGARVLSELG
jgi:hypothetical protein